MAEAAPPEVIHLPAALRSGGRSLEEVLAGRRSVREFKSGQLTEPELSQLLWAAQGLRDSEGNRTAPSAGALYPLEIYVAMEQGCYRYDPPDHTLVRIVEADLREPIYRVALHQQVLLQAAAIFIIAGVYKKIAVEYGKACAPLYVQIETGHAAQNLLLQAVSLRLGAVPIGAFKEPALRKLLGLPVGQKPLYLIPVGRPA